MILGPGPEGPVKSSGRLLAENIHEGHEDAASKDGDSDEPDNRHRATRGDPHHDPSSVLGSVILGVVIPVLIDHAAPWLPHSTPALRFDVIFIRSMTGGWRGAFSLARSQGEPVGSEVREHLAFLPTEDLRSKQAADYRSECDAAVGDGFVVARNRRHCPH